MAKDKLSSRVRRCAQQASHNESPAGFLANPYSKECAKSLRLSGRTDHFIAKGNAFDGIWPAVCVALRNSLRRQSRIKLNPSPAYD
jgi:hypothetical protein